MRDPTLHVQHFVFVSSPVGSARADMWRSRLVRGACKSGVRQLQPPAPMQGELRGTGQPVCAGCVCSCLHSVFAIRPECLLHRAIKTASPYPGVPRGTPGFPEIPRGTPVCPWVPRGTSGHHGVPGYLGEPRGPPGHPGVRTPGFPGEVRGTSGYVGYTCGAPCHVPRARSGAPRGGHEFTRFGAHGCPGTRVSSTRPR
jgi:hypothetical protein